ncbi:hypothetical protein Q3G72_000107 [Acer saccharum]|nr:hypothetical protein Q3G72_000107 [Acer saccharum]
MTVRDLVSLSSMISCFMNNGLGYESFAFFLRMQLVGNVKPDEVTMLIVVSSVSSLGALELEEEKEHSLGCHSEKLPIAFALLSVKEMKTMRIMKNLQTCNKKYHSFRKHDSGKFNKGIIV